MLSMLAPQVAIAGGERLETSGRAVALGGAFVGLGNSAYAIFYNPAGLSRLALREVSGFYARPFGLSELSYFNFAYADPLLLPESFGTMGVAAQRYGFDLYNETKFSLAYANSFEQKFFYGVTVSYNTLAIATYGTDAAFGIDAGVMALLSPQLAVGFAATNLNRPVMSTAAEPLAQTYTLGASYRMLTNVMLVADLEKDVRYPLSIKAGAEYEPVASLALRLGFATEPSKLTGGIGLRYAGIEFDYAFYSHPDLGLTHQASVSLAFGGASIVDAATKREEEDRRITDAFDELKPRLAPGEKINLNTAELDDLLRLGISKTIANRILGYRKEYKRFSLPSELLRVRGVTKEFFKSIEAYLITE